MKQTDKWSKTLFYFENLIDFVIFIISPRNYIFGAFYLRCSYIVAFSFEWAWDFVNFFRLIGNQIIRHFYSDSGAYHFTLE